MMISNVRYKRPVESSLSKTAISLGGTGALSPELAAGFESHLSEIISNSGQLLITVIQNKLAAVTPAHKRNRKWVGKKLNQLFGLDAECIELSGTELLAAMKLLKEDVELEVSRQGSYLVPVAEAEKVVSKLIQSAKAC